MIITGRKVRIFFIYLVTSFSSFYLCLDDDNDLTARKAFESVLRVSLLQPTSPKFHNFSEIVRKLASQKYDYNFIDGEEVSSFIIIGYRINKSTNFFLSKVNFFIGAFYDGVLLLGMALNETLTQGGNLRDGAEITKKM